MDANEFAKLIKEKGYQIRITALRSGVVEINGNLPEGKIGITLTTMQTSPPSGVYKFTAEEEVEFDEALSAVMFKLKNIIEKANSRIVNGDVII